MNVKHCRVRGMSHPSIGKLIAIGILRKLPWDGHADAASCTTHEITLNERLAQLNAVIDPLNRLAEDVRAARVCRQQRGERRVLAFEVGCELLMVAGASELHDNELVPCRHQTTDCDEKQASMKRQWSK